MYSLTSLYGVILPVTDAIKAGDIIGFSGFYWQSVAINLATYGVPFWSLSHVGIMAHADDGRLLLFESTSLDELPCEIMGKPFAGVQAHVLEDILRIYRGRVWHYPIYRPLYFHESARLTKCLLDAIGTPYDELGAYRAAGVGLSWVESLLRPQDLSLIFCSELCCFAHTNIGLFQTDDASRWNPNRFTRTERQQHILLKPRRLSCG